MKMIVKTQKRSQSMETGTKVGGTQKSHRSTCLWLNVPMAFLIPLYKFPSLDFL